MSYSCIVASCNTRRKRNTDKTTGIKCFSFPKDPDLKSLWLNLCQATEVHKKKVCIKHFKEDDFIDGLKARLMCVEPTRLKKDAVPSLFLCPETLTDESKQKQIQNQEEILKKYISTKKRQVRMSPKVRISNPTKGTMEYLSKLVPIAPKSQGLKKATMLAPKKLLLPPKNHSLGLQWPRIAMKKPTLAPESPAKLPIAQKDPVTLITHSNMPDLITKTQIAAPETQNCKLKPNLVKQQNIKNQQIEAEYLQYQFKILEHDNVIYKKRIETLKEKQNTLLSRIKDLEANIVTQKEDFVRKVKGALSHVFTSNQVDNVLGKRKHIWWTDEEYAKSLKLLHMSRQAYKYIKDVMNYPLPNVANVYKWSNKHGLKSQLENSKLNCENKENGERDVIDSDQMMLDDQSMLGDDQIMLEGDVADVKREIKKELADGDMKNIVNIEFDQDLNDNEYTIKVHNVKDQCDIEYEIDCTDYNVIENSSDDQNIILDHHHNDIDEHDMNYDQNDEFYEELVIDNDYSDDDMMFDPQKVKCVEKDNG